MSRRRTSAIHRTAASPPRKGELYPDAEAMKFWLEFFGYPTAPIPFKKENGVCYWGLGGNQKEDDDDDRDECP